MQKGKGIKKTIGARAVLFLMLSTIGFVFIFSHITSASATRNDGNIVTGASGASLPYTEMEAHNASTNGTILGPSYQPGNLASDAVDRMAVQLTPGQFVQFTLSQTANSINLRYSIPDASSGGGSNAQLSIY